MQRFAFIRRWAPFTLFLVAALLVIVFLYMRSDNLSSEDGFYHFRHAALYRTNGIGMSAFSWIPYSVIHTDAADIWYGFHILLIPFTWISDPVIGLRVAGIVITFVTVLLFYYTARRLGVRWRFVWPFLFLFASPFSLFRLTMARPHVLSIGLGALFFSFLVSGSWVGVFITSFAMVFLHIALFWVPAVIFGVVAGVKFFTEKTVEWRSGLAFAGGMVTGWLLRPNPLGALHLTYIQIVQLLIEKFKGTPLHFGMELNPLGFAGFGTFFGFLVLWIATLFLFAWFCARRFRGQGAALGPVVYTKLWASGILSTLFFAMTLMVAQRSLDFWVVFGALFIAFLFSHFLDEHSPYKEFVLAFNNRRRLVVAGILFGVVMMIFSLYQQGVYLNKFGWYPPRFQGAAEWLKKNSNAGDIVFNTSWDYFPELFFWNTKNRYISGMDPIFQYAYAPSLYWRSYYLETGATDRFTCASTHCESDQLEDTYAVLKNDFKARYIFVTRPADERLYVYLASDSRFWVRYDDGYAAIFELKK